MSAFPTRSDTLTRANIFASRYKEEISTRLVLAAAPLLYNFSTDDNARLDGSSPQAGPSNSGPMVAGVTAVHAKDYRTYVITLNVSSVGGGLVIGGTKQVTTCASFPHTHLHC